MFATRTMKPFYFVFGTDSQYPFYKGWIEIYAESLEQACKVFRVYFPDYYTGIVNCAWIYSQEQWEKKVKEGCFDSPDDFCHGVFKFNSMR